MSRYHIRKLQFILLSKSNLSKTAINNTADNTDSENFYLKIKMYKMFKTTLSETDFWWTQEFA